MASSPPATWAIDELRQALEGAGARATVKTSLQQIVDGNRCILVAGAESPAAKEVLEGAGAPAPNRPESLALTSGSVSGRDVLLACGYDPRGAVYSVLELADRVRHSSDIEQALTVPGPISESPQNRVRSIARLFVSDVEDKPWFNDREMWPQYLTMLAENRFNRFNLSLGIGYDFLREVTDAYFLFAYPFFLDVPGHDVRVTNLPNEERDRNLETLRFVSEETVKRGLEFQLGIWTHGYEWVNSPYPNHVIQGLSAENHGAYCGDALAALLEACPAITGVTLRIHGESGVAEGSYDFWKMVFEGAARSGRRVELDLHAKGIDSSMIDVALASGLPVKLAPKYWAEHLGMPYHQAAIRELEMPRKARDEFFAISFGSRRFTRYGYADLMRNDRGYGIIHRIWPGTQRLLLWGDPHTAAAYSRAFGFSGSDGVEIMEPLSFKGRRGSGIAGDRCAYEDASLRPKWDWQKYLYSYRVWGRHLFNPDRGREAGYRLLETQFSAAAAPMETALAHASRILPIVTTAHGASAGNNTYWPEVYTNLPIVDPNRKHPYRDTPEPKVFGNVSPMDPEMFSSGNECAQELLGAKPKLGRYSPIDVSIWLERLADAAGSALDTAKQQAADTSTPEFRRATIDAEVQIELGRFFAAKLRSGVLFSVFEQARDRAPLEKALELYRQARAAWSRIVGLTGDVYVTDITVGERPNLRGHWSDRLAEIDGDIGDMDLRLQASGDTSSSASSAGARTAIEAALTKEWHARSLLAHEPAGSFAPGRLLKIEVPGERRRRSRRSCPSLPSRQSGRTVCRRRYAVCRRRALSSRDSFALHGHRLSAAVLLCRSAEPRRSRRSSRLWPGADRAALSPGSAGQRRDGLMWEAKRIK